MLIDLDVLSSYSRLRVSNDDPHSESCFKALKYAPAYPGRFADMQLLQSYFREFFPRYDTELRHSGLGLLTPDAVHHGRAAALQERRQIVLACASRPERFVHGAPRAPRISREIWINRPENIIECTTAAR